MKKELTLGYCPVGNGHSIKPFDQVFARSINIAETMTGVDAVVFWGGSDIHPSYYNEERHPYSQATDKPSARDTFEWKAMLYCQMNNIPMIGVCRGAQMMCAFAGGFLIQDTNKHNRGDHLMLTTEGEIISTTSAHHQMMYPYNVEHELLAWSHKCRGDWHDGPSKRGPDLLEGKEEPEVVYFPDIRGLAIQGHPEWAHEHGRFNHYINNLVRSKLLAEETV